MTSLPSYIAVVLAGGAARRMGDSVRHGLKLLLPYHGRPILDHITTALSASDHPPADIVLNIAADQRDTLVRHAPDYPVAIDDFTGREGPLAGILAGLDWCRTHRPGIKWVLTVPGDVPLLPADLASRLLDTAPEYVACAASRGRPHPPIAVWSVGLHAPLAKAMTNGTRKIDRFTEPYTPTIVEWTTEPDPFLNMNTPEDLT